MKDSIQEKLSVLVERFEEIGHLLSEPEVISEQNRFRDLSKEYARLEELAKDFGAYQKLEEGIRDARELQEGDDAELRELGEDELQTLLAQREVLERRLTAHLIPADPDDDAKPLADGIEAQTRRVMDNLVLVLGELGLGLEQVTSARVFLTDFERDYAGLNEVYAPYFPAGRLPARTCVGVTALARGALVEIDMIAKRP